MRTGCLSVALSSVVFAGAGCATDGSMYVTPARQARGLVMILPGVEGRSSLNDHIRQGLNGAGVFCALEVRQWGFLVPVVKLAVNQTNVPGNRHAAAVIAKEIVAYRKQYPGRSVYLVGHSAGGGLAVFVLEALDKIKGNHYVDGVVLLSASISNDYDLTTALRHSRSGIVNFYNESDLALLGLATTLLGNVDGGRSASAGRTGFIRPDPDLEPQKAHIYSRLYQVQVTRGMLGPLSGPHVASTNISFIATYVAEWVLTPTWPPAMRVAHIDRRARIGTLRPSHL